MNTGIAQVRYFKIDISTIISFNAFLPKDETFMPNLQVLVYDQIMRGWINNLIG
jgi:hypothetical protein